MTDKQERKTPNDRFLDVHHHILYGLDDGPENEAEMDRMLEAASEDGTGLIFATPHIFPGKRPFSMADYQRTLEKANVYCRRKRLPLKVLGGAEICFTDAAVRLLDEGKIPTMNGTRFVLTEWSPHEGTEEIVRGIGTLCGAGYIPIIAHVERLRNLKGKWKTIEDICSRYDVRIQMDCEALLQGMKSFFPSFAQQALNRRMIDYVASDAHNVGERRSCMRQAHEVIARKWGNEYAEQLMIGNAEELLGREWCKHDIG